MYVYNDWEKAIVVNLEFIKAIVTAEEVLLLDPFRQKVLPFVDQLQQQLPHKSVSKSQGGGQMDCDLPFEFQVLKIALKVFCTYLDSSVADLERNAYLVLDELVSNVSTKNLEHVRSLKSNLTSLLARVQKVILSLGYTFELLTPRTILEPLWLTSTLTLTCWPRCHYLDRGVHHQGRDVYYLGRDVIPK
ncbi:hypothetical protein CsSME_00013091 [Camellia sinensis var. sinensis]